MCSFFFLYFYFKLMLWNVEFVVVGKMAVSLLLFSCLRKKRQTCLSSCSVQKRQWNLDTVKTHYFWGSKHSFRNSRLVPSLKVNVTFTEKCSDYCLDFKKLHLLNPLKSTAISAQWVDLGVCITHSIMCHFSCFPSHFQTFLLDSNLCFFQLQHLSFS